MIFDKINIIDTYSLFNNRVGSLNQTLVKSRYLTKGGEGMGETISAQKGNVDQVSLVLQAQDNNPQALEIIIGQYRKLIHSIAQKLSLPCGEHEDLVQEGMIGLWEAIKRFDPAKKRPFASLAKICIKGKIINALKAARSKANDFLNSAKRFSDSYYEDKSLLDLIADDSVKSPEEIYLEKEGREELLRSLRGEKGILTELEFRALIGIYVLCKLHREIAEELGRSVKSIDNAIRRAKEKIQNNFTFEYFAT